MRLPYSLYDCPFGWQKFIYIHESELSTFSPKDNLITLNCLLSEYKAVYHKEDDMNIIVFHCEKFYTLFLLRYGAMDKNDY